MDEHELIPNPSRSKISINLGYGNPFEAGPYRLDGRRYKKLTAIIVVCVLFLLAGKLILNRISGKKKIQNIVKPFKTKI